MATAKTTAAKAKSTAKQTTETVEKAVTETAENVEKVMTEAAEAVADVFNAKGFEVPEMFRSFAEKGVTQAREHYAQFKANAEDATDLIEETYETARGGMIDLQHQALDVAKQNADATFDFAKQFLGVTSVADAVQLQAKFAREQYEACADYAKEFQSTFSKIAEETVAPSKAAFSKALSAAK